MARYIDGFFVTAGLFVATFLLTGLTEMSLWLRALTALLALCVGAAVFAAIVKRNSGGADTRDFVTYCALEPSFAEKVFEGDAEIFYNIGFVYGEKGEREKSIEYYKKAIEADPKLSKLLPKKK